MAGRTVSAYADEETARVIERLAAFEDRSPAQIAAAALRFYARLPAEAHAAFRRLEKLGTEQDLSALAREIARKTLDAEWDVAHRQFLNEMNTTTKPDDEEALLAEAVRLTR